MQPNKPPNLQSLMEQMIGVRDGLVTAQQELTRKEHVAEGGGGLVSVTVNGMGEVVGLQLDPEVKRHDPSDLEQMILDALREAQQAAKKHAEQAAAAFGQRHAPR